MIISALFALVIGTGIWIVYNRGKRPPVEMVGVIEHQKWVSYRLIYSGQGKFKPSFSPSLMLSIKIDYVGNLAYQEEFVGKSVDIFWKDSRFDSRLKEGDRVTVSLKRFVSPNGENKDKYEIKETGQVVLQKERKA